MPRDLIFWHVASSSRLLISLFQLCQGDLKLLLQGVHKLNIALYIENIKQFFFSEITRPGSFILSMNHDLVDIC